MSDFRFEDDDEDELSNLPSMDESPPAPLSAEPSAPQTNAPTVGVNQSIAPPKSAAPSPMAPRAPSPSVPSPKAPSPPVSSAKAPLTAKAPSPPIPVATTRATPGGAAPSGASRIAASGSGKAPGNKAASGSTLPPLTEAEMQGGELARRHMTLSAKPKVESVRVATLDRVLDFLTPIATWLLRASMALGGVALLYLAYLAATGGLTQGGEDPRIIGNVALAASFLRWAMVGAALSCALLVWDERATGIVIVILGVALGFGAVPLLGALGHTRAIGTLAIALGAGGRALVGVGLLKCTYDLIMWVIELPERMRVKADVGMSQQAEPKQQREAQNATMFSPCWKLPFCREVIRKQCPAYLAKTTCWKFGRGCYCDEEMISRIVRGEALDVIKAPTRMSQQGKPPCNRCYIFLEHQGLKYRVVSPLALPATLVAMYAAWPLYTRMSDKLSVSLQGLWDRLSFHGSTAITDAAAKVASKGGTAPSTLSPDQVQHAAQIMFAVLAGFYLLILISKAIEWAVYKARL